MKLSQIIGILIFLILAIAIFAIVKNENKELKRGYNISTGKTETYDPDYKGFGVTQMSEESLELRKSKQRNKILMIGGGILAFIAIIFFVTKSNEDKKDPIKNLATLKDRNIITQSEYEDKLRQSKEVEQNNKILENKKKEYKKLLSELNNLKAKGILTEEEYQQKLNKIKEKTA